MIKENKKLGKLKIALPILAIATASCGVALLHDANPAASANAAVSTNYVDNGDITSTEILMPTGVTNESDMVYMTAPNNSPDEGIEIFDMQTDAAGNKLVTKSENGTEYSGYYELDGETYPYDIVIRISSWDNHQPYGKGADFVFGNTTMQTKIAELYSLGQSDQNQISNAKYAFQNYIGSAQGIDPDVDHVEWVGKGAQSNLIYFGYVDREVHTYYMVSHMFDDRVGKGGNYLATVRVLVDVVPDNNTEVYISPTAAHTIPEQDHMMRVDYDFAGLPLTQAQKTTLEAGQWNNLHNAVVDLPNTVNNIYFKSAGSEAQKITELSDMTIAVNVRSNGFEFSKYTNGSTATAFAEGDQITLKQGMYFPSGIVEGGAFAAWIYYGNTGYRYRVLDRDMTFEYTGGEWSMDLTSVIINTESEVSILTDETHTLSISTQAGPNVTTVGSPSFVSSNEVVATVDSNGTITGLTEGTAVITVTVNTSSVQVPVTVTARTVDSISVTPTTVSMKDDGTATLTATVTGNALDKSVSYSSDNEAVATVNASGVITAHSAGTATITVTSNFDSTKTATVSVTVNPYTVDSVTVTPTTVSIKDDETATVTPTVTGDASDKTVSYSSDNTAVATVNANGVITAVAAGTATITVTSNFDSTKSATVTVTVSAYTVDSVTVTRKSVALKESGTTTIVPTVNGDAKNKNVTYSSNNEAVATVNANGLITAVAEGTATITVTSVFDPTKSATVTVTVSAFSIDSVTATPTTVTIKDDGNATITVDVAGDAADKTVSFESDNEEVATVDENGKITAHKAGIATITVTSNFDSEKTATVTVTVEAYTIDTLTVGASAVNLKVGGTSTIVPSVTGDAADKSVSYSSDNEAVATVDANGKITAVSAGTATITVTSNFDSEKTATVTVTVTEDENQGGDEPGTNPGTGDEPATEPEGGNGDDNGKGGGCGSSVAGIYGVGGGALLIGAVALIALRKKQK